MRQKQHSNSFVVDFSRELNFYFNFYLKLFYHAGKGIIYNGKKRSVSNSYICLYITFT